MGKIPWGRWYALLKVVVLLPIFILAIATVAIIALFDPAKLSTGAGIIYFDYEAKIEQPSLKRDQAPVHLKTHAAAPAEKIEAMLGAALGP